MENVRLQKFLAEHGVASRRKCEEFITEGRVRVNGKIITELGTKINPIQDKVSFDGKDILNSKDKHVYILLNKPIGVVTTVKDQFDRQCVLDIIKINKRIVPVGRLDMYTSGALILTDDGEFIYKVTHPKHEIPKTYTVTVKGILSDNDIENLSNGVEIDTGYITKPAKAKIIKIDKEKDISRVEIIIHEGKNRQVRKMCEAIGKKVIALHRTKIGNIQVKNLKIGEWRYLKEFEIKDLLS